MENAEHKEKLVSAEAKLEEKPLIYELKRIDFLNRKAPIVLQNENGPCPLIAIGTQPLVLIIS
jgi:hypothetical protein